MSAKTLQIAGRRLPQALVLSPMVDVTDAAFRSVAKEWGADVTCSEMVSAVGLVHDNARSWWHLQPWPGESPYGVQFMCGETQEMAAAVRTLATRIRPDFVDVNLGCPAPNILKLCAGGFLMKDPKKAGAVIRAARQAADEVGIRHVSAKMRLGPNDRHLTYLEVAQEAQAAGADWVTLHARTVAQGYSGKADWSHIARLVERVDIPVIGNGDIRTPEDVVRMRDETNCAGFFIARAAMHDPTIFKRMRAALDGSERASMGREGAADGGQGIGVGAGAPQGLGAPDMVARLRTFLVYLDRAQAIGVTSMGDFRRQATRFVAGAHGARHLRVRLHDAKDITALRAAVALAVSEELAIGTAVNASGDRSREGQPT